MHSIVTSFKGITKDASTDFYNVGDIYIQYGLSCIPCLCTADIIDVYSVLGIDRVVLIFDLDGPMGGMLTYEDVKKRYTEISGVEILYYPIAWCAETLLHYQICSYVTDAILDVLVLKQRLLEIDRQKLLDRELQRSITIIMAGGNKPRALMAELADALDLGSKGRPCGFESH